MSYEEMINRVIKFHLSQFPKLIRRIAVGICNEVYDVVLSDKEVIIRLSHQDKYLMGSHDHIPKFKSLGINVILPRFCRHNYAAFLH